MSFLFAGAHILFTGVCFLFAGSIIPFGVSSFLYEGAIIPFSGRGILFDIRSMPASIRRTYGTFISFFYLVVTNTPSLAGLWCGFNNQLSEFSNQ
ncbi:MAG: hypothetical protein V2A54_17290 [Bacteroidota bacterium]